MLSRTHVAVLAVSAALVGVSGSHAAASGTDPDLEPGFPVQTYERAGSYHAGPAINVLVGNIDSDPTLEILVTALALGPLYAWNADGSPQAGWPVAGFQRVGYPSLGQLSNSPGLEVFSGHWGFPGKLVAYDGSGTILPGWPRDSANYVDTPAALGDVNADGLDEIFVEEQIWKLHGYWADGSILPGWPVYGTGGQQRHTPAIADLDGDASPEIVTASGWTTIGLGVYLFAYHADGTTIAGFPVGLESGYGDTFPVIGDVDGDGPAGDSRPGVVRNDARYPGALGERHPRADDERRRHDLLRHSSGARRLERGRSARDRAAD